MSELECDCGIRFVCPNEAEEDKIIECPSCHCRYVGHKDAAHGRWENIGAVPDPALRETLNALESENRKLKKEICNLRRFASGAPWEG